MQTGTVPAMTLCSGPQWIDVTWPQPRPVASAVFINRVVSRHPGSRIAMGLYVIKE